MATVPSGLSLLVNGTSGTTPLSATLVEGSTTTLSAPSPQVLNGTTYVFSSWSNGGAQTHTISANASATYTATYTPQAGGTGYAARSSPTRRSPTGASARRAGATAADASGQQPHGLVPEHALTRRPRRADGWDSNSAVSFNGVDEYVNVPLPGSAQPERGSRSRPGPIPRAARERSARSSRAVTTLPVRAKGYVLYAAPTTPGSCGRARAAGTSCTGPRSS